MTPINDTNEIKDTEIRIFGGESSIGETTMEAIEDEQLRHI